ncbi:RHS repeat protein [bacterium]|nr:RHS repeat protein [bacterium]
MTDPSSGETTYSYDELNRVIEINDAQSDTYEFEYDKDGRRTKLTYGNDSYTKYYYDNAGRMDTIDNLKSNGTTVSSIKYTFDACNHLLQLLPSKLPGPIRSRRPLRALLYPVIASDYIALSESPRLARLCKFGRKCPRQC